MQRILTGPALAFVLFGLCARILIGQDNETKLDPKDFMIPDRVLSALNGEITLRTSGGYFAITNQSFSDWLKKTGPFGEMVALNDQREWNEACGIPTLGNAVPDRDLRVCDVAYQTIVISRKENRKLLMKTDSTRSIRDTMIAGILKNYPSQFVSSSESQGTKE